LPTARATSAFATKIHKYFQPLAGNGVATPLATNVQLPASADLILKILIGDWTSHMDLELKYVYMECIEL
jgi:hypothetical protein